MREITIGQYYPVNSVIHSLDPRSKMMSALLFIVALFLVRNPVWFVGFLLITVVEYRLANVPFGYFLKGLRTVIILLVFTFVFRTLATPGECIFSWWIFDVTREGLVKGTQLASRIALMIIEASLLAYTTTPKEMADGLAQAFTPFKKVGLPVDEMSIMIMIAFRFIPVMLEEANDLMDAQVSRGVEFENCSMITKMKNIFALLVPLFIGSIERSADLAMAMEARGYSPDKPRSRMFPLAYSSKDRTAYIASIILLAIVIAARIAGVI